MLALNLLLCFERHQDCYYLFKTNEYINRGAYRRSIHHMADGEAYAPTKKIISMINFKI